MHMNGKGKQRIELYSSSYKPTGNKEEQVESYCSKKEQTKSKNDS